MISHKIKILIYMVLVGLQMFLNVAQVGFAISSDDCTASHESSVLDKSNDIAQEQ